MEFKALVLKVKRSWRNLPSYWVEKNKDFDNRSLPERGVSQNLMNYELHVIQ